jgi:membrane protease YdiL (CAAX protease family)
VRAPRLPASDTRQRATFIALAYGLSWLAWSPLVIAARTGTSGWRYFHLLGGLGPACAAFIVALTAKRNPHTTAHRRDSGSLLRQLLRGLDPRRTQLRWLALGLFGPLGLFVLAAVILRVTGQPWPDLGGFGRNEEYPALGRAYPLASLVFYGLGEEIGWRGYLLRSLAARRRPLVAALLVSVVWALWHLPLFWFATGMRAMGPADIAGWFMSIVTGSILMTWLFARSGGSIAAVALFHGALDVVMGVAPGQPLAINIMGGALTIAGIAAAFWLPRCKDLPA